MTLFNLPVSPTNLLFGLNVALHRLQIHYSSNKHPASTPFISGDGFRKLAQHIYDQDEVFDPVTVRVDDLIFVSLVRLDEFFANIHPHIRCRYRLITHNGDTQITKKYLQYIDTKILAWWSQNVLVTHPKLHPIPIGLENLSYYNHGIPALYISKMQNTPEIPRVLYGFSISTNPTIRMKAYSDLEKIPTTDPVPTRLNSREYVRLLSRYQFVASPPGNGEDCIRTWEAMYCGVIPIVLSSVLMQTFEKMKLPIWIVNDYRELELYTEKDLLKIYKRIRRNSSIHHLNLQYWTDRIQNNVY